jgi:hypothetical protein
LRKRLRLHPHWKLRPVRRWVDFAPYVSSISLTFDPALYGSAGARELARQVQGTKVREKFSSCAVKVTETEDGVPAIVEIKWVSQSTTGALISGWLESCSPLPSPPRPAPLRRALCPQSNGKTSFAPAQFATFEEILEHFEVPRQQLNWEKEDADMQ